MRRRGLIGAGCGCRKLHAHGAGAAGHRVQPPVLQPRRRQELRMRTPPRLSLRRHPSQAAFIDLQDYPSVTLTRGKRGHRVVHTAGWVVVGRVYNHKITTASQDYKPQNKTGANGVHDELTVPRPRGYSNRPHLHLAPTALTTSYGVQGPQKNFESARGLMRQKSNRAQPTGTLHEGCRYLGSRVSKSSKIS